MEKVCAFIDILGFSQMVKKGDVKKLKKAIIEMNKASEGTKLLKEQKLA